MSKICSKCNVEKDIFEFYPTKFSYTARCKVCIREKNREYKNNNKEYYSEYNKKYREDNREELINYSKNWREENRSSFAEKRREYYQENMEYIKKRNYEYCKNRRKSDPLYKLTLGIRCLILASFKTQYTKKSKKTMEILGCTFEEFKGYLESKFDENMNWTNQGIYWHMDHIIPISSAKSVEEVYQLNHYTNFQPLYWKDNLSKGNKVLE